MQKNSETNTHARTVDHIILILIGELRCGATTAGIDGIELRGEKIQKIQIGGRGCGKSLQAMRALGMTPQEYHKYIIDMENKINLEREEQKKLNRIMDHLLWREHFYDY